MAGDYTKWKCPICNHYLKRKSIKKSAGKIFFPMREGIAVGHNFETDEILVCAVCDYACREPNPTLDIDKIVIPEFLKKYADEGASGTDIHIQCTKCLIRYKFGVIRTDKRMGAALYDDPKMEWYRCTLDEGHPGNHLMTEETPAGVMRLEWSDKSDVNSSPI